MREGRGDGWWECACAIETDGRSKAGWKEIGHMKKDGEARIMRQCGFGRWMLKSNEQAQADFM